MLLRGTLETLEAFYGLNLLSPTKKHSVHKQLFLYSKVKSDAKVSTSLISINMHLTLLAIFGFFLHNNFATESRQISPDGVVYDGFKADAFRRITTHLIETNLVNKLGLCALKCLKKVECVSFNFGNPVNGKHVCELLRTDKYNSRSSYVNSTDYHYFYPGVSKLHRYIYIRKSTKSFYNKLGL
jgi:hypothetical protein